MGRIDVSPDFSNPFLRIEVGEIKTSITEDTVNKAVRQLSLRLAFLSYVAHFLCLETRGNLIGRVFVRKGTSNSSKLQKLVNQSLEEGHSEVRLAPGFTLSISGELV